MKTRQAWDGNTSYTAFAYLPESCPIADCTIRIDRMMTRFGEVEWFVVDLRKKDDMGSGEVIGQDADYETAMARALRAL